MGRMHQAPWQYTELSWGGCAVPHCWIQNFHGEDVRAPCLDTRFRCRSLCQAPWLDTGSSWGGFAWHMSGNRVVMKDVPGPITGYSILMGRCARPNGWIKGYHREDVPCPMAGYMIPMGRCARPIGWVQGSHGADMPDPMAGYRFYMEIMC